MKPGQIAAIAIGGLAVAGLVLVRIGSNDADAIEVPESTAAEAAVAPESTPPTTEAASEAKPPDNLGPAGTLTNLDGWLQTDATSFSDFDGQVKIVQFWTFSCYNCTNTIPYLGAIYETYHDDGLEIIGVHAPEFDFERDPEAIAAAAVEEGVTWPIAIDNAKTNFRRWQSGGKSYWPRTYVVDANGDIRFDHIGEGAYDELEAAVAYLLASGGA